MTHKHTHDVDDDDGDDSLGPPTANTNPSSAMSHGCLVCVGAVGWYLMFGCAVAERDLMSVAHCSLLLFPP